MKFLRFIGLQINGLFPFLFPLRNIFKGFHIFRGIFDYCIDYFKYKKLFKQKDISGIPFPLHLINNYPCLYDRYEDAGDVPKHYFFQDLWAAKKVYDFGKAIHHDSRITP